MPPACSRHPEHPCSKDLRPLPTVEVEYHNLRIEADALVGKAGNPSVLNSALGLLRTVTLQRPPTAPHTILDGISGVLKPGWCSYGSSR